ncbi:MAG: S8 family serine peptidase [Bacteroidales bacterium]|nr:S8 family serine peptidase [Bacteroidales bacterium]
MRELRQILMLAVFALMTLVTFGQKYNSLWVDGRIYFKVSNSVSLDVPNENGRIMPKDLPFLGDLVDEYQITNVDMPFLSASSNSIRHTWRMDFGAIDKIETLIKDMEKIGVVEYAEPAPLFFISQTVNDPYYNRTLNYTPSGLEFLYGSAFSVNSSWHLDLINAEDAWDETNGSSEITVAVLDNAIYVDHPDLTNMIDRENSTDLGDGDNDPNPPVANYIWSHGTHSAGLIGAEKDNGIGVASIGSGVKIMAVKLGTDASDGQSMAAGFEGIIYAADHGADVINMSWGSPQFFQTMQNIVNYAYNKGCILLGAAGNNGNGAESQMNEDIPVNYTGYPAALEHVIAVGSCNSDDKKSDFSCYGTWLDLLSPGGYAYQATGMMPITSFSVLSTTYNTAGTFGDMLSGQLGGITGGEMEFPTGGAGSCGIEGQYDIMQGTSMACPVASGLAGLVLSKNPTLTPEELTAVMKSTCVNVDAQNPEFVDSMGAGRIDAYAAVHAAGLLNMDLVADFEASEVILATGDAINFTDKTIGNPTSWLWEFEGGTPAYSEEQNPQNIAYNEEGIYQVRLTVSDGTNEDTETKTYFILVGQSSTLGESAWEEQNTHFAAQYRGSYNIEIVDPQTVWFTTLNGTDGTVARDFGVTTDGGTTWTPKTFSYDADWMPGDISPINGTTAWSANYSSSASGKGAIFKTTDGGDTWTRQGEELYQNDASFLNIVHFFNENEGYAQGDPVNNNFEIFRTTDGGETWTAATAPAAQSQEASTVGLDWAICDIAWFGTNKGRIYKTTDKGANWTVLSTGTTKMITEMSWADEMNGAVTVANLDQTTGQTSAWQFLKTTDGGETWSEVGVTANYFSSFCLVPGTPGMIVITKSASTLPENFSAYSTDWGTSWEMLDDSIQYIQVRMHDINTGWAGGFNWDENNGGIYKWRGIEMGLHFTSIPVRSAVEYEEYTYNVTAENEIDCAITITMTDGPDWLSISRNGNEYVLSGTVPHITGLTADFDVELTATDCEDSKTQAFTITVSTANTAPVFVSEPIEIAIVNEEYIYNIVCEDADNDQLTITARQKPSWATFTDNGDGTAELRGTSTTVTSVGTGSRVLLVVEDGLYTTSQDFRVRTNSASAIEDFGMGAIELYPNPTDGMLTVENCEGANYEIFDITGKVVAAGNITNKVQTINIADEITGNLVIRIINNDKVVTRPIVKF